MFVQTLDYDVIDCSRIRMGTSQLYSGTRYEITAQLISEPSDRGVSYVGLYQTFDRAEARKLISLMVCSLNDGSIVIPLPELVARLKLEAKQDPAPQNSVPTMRL